MLTLLRLLVPIVMLLIVLIGSLARMAHAQPATGAPSAPTAEQLEAARKALPSKAELDAAARALQAAPGVRLAPAAVEPTRQAAPDLSQLATQYDRVLRGPRAQRESGDLSGLMVFVSLSMPPATLDRIIAEAEKTGALLMLRGVQERSVKKTVARIQALLGTRQVAWQIDPSNFKRFAIGAVPSYVLVDPARPVSVACGQAQCQQPAFSKVAGDVSTRYALESIVRSDPEFGALAGRFIQRLGSAR